jgi:hypothetical protein
MHKIVMRKPLGEQPIETEEGGRIMRRILGGWVIRMVGGGSF